MVSWPAGHRIEDYQFKVYDSAFAWVGDLGTVHGAAGSRTLYGQFGGKCTFELSLDDPWAAVLSAEAQHFIKVLRDGVQIFAGMQVKLERENEPAKEAGFVKFQFLPLAFLAKWRHCLAIPPATTLETSGTKVDDAFKWIVERVLGATAPNTPTTGLARAVTGFTIAADKTEYPTNVGLDPTNQNLYEYLQRWGANFDVDWDIFLNGSDAPEFETWYPRRGLDRSEANGTNAEAIFTDAMGDILRVSYGMDTTDAKTVIISADGLVDVAAAAGDRSAWLIREALVRNRDTTTMQVALEDKRPKVWCKLEEYAETRGLQWKEGSTTAEPYFSVGDKATWYSLNMGYGPTSDVICQIDWEIDKDGFEHLTLTFGDPEPDITDKMRGGTGGSTDPDYTDPGAALRVLGILADDTNTAYPAVGTNKWTLAGGTGASTTAAASTLTVNTVWDRNTAGTAYLHQATHGDDLKLFTGADGLVAHVQAADGKSWFADDMYIGANSGAAADRLHLYAAGGAVYMRAQGSVAVRFGEEGSGICVVDNLGGGSVSTRHGGVGTESCHFNTVGVYIVNSGYLRVQTGAVGSSTVFEVAGNTGNTAWAAGAKWTIEGDQYTLPTAFPVSTGMALVGTDAGVLSWAAAAPAAHDIVSAHSYTGGAALDVFGLSAANTIAKLTPSSAPGAASAILKTDASGYLRLQRLELQGASNYITVASSDLTIYAGGDDLSLGAIDKVFIYCNGANRYQFGDNGILPFDNNTYPIGSTTLKFSALYCYDAHFYDDVVIDGDCTITGTPKLGTYAARTEVNDWTGTLTVQDKNGNARKLMIITS